ncbi:MAG: internalization-related competence protein ComEC/Rec2 protein [Candidatus Beckwithbacteria bacterium GW2011_GWA2_43_10]|uniref:Internalization-related competence protein ComEC/Rec2 protein n=1 Tax=Candidatus Beckwithbacteria bacterium GW2011_GWA2_43_10 TaxID=1618369 RepID=A0A0G1C454_9BACT|nr:MAG: internalization-related competence protein ComEC/Rec2 protein [Candidatus Beckwithbacteria bacterium GW2011_GWA2_43_10]
MKRVKKINILLGLLIGLVCFLIWQWPDNRLHLIFCNVGQGDAMLLEYGSYQILVDAGPDNSVLSCLGKVMPFWDRKLELVVLTHPEADHLTGLIEVVKRYQVGKLMKTKAEHTTPEFAALTAALEARRVKVQELMAGDKIKLNQVNLEILWPLESTSGVSSSFNQWSTVILGQYGVFGFLLTGDITETEEQTMINLASLRPVEVLKVAHHGSKFSSSQKFLEAVRPKLAVISVGRNSFGHPTPEALARLKAVGAKVLRTDVAGTIEIVVE